jgi:hypothetical protein
MTGCRRRVNKTPLEAGPDSPFSVLLKEAEPDMPRRQFGKFMPGMLMNILRGDDKY